jgi:hypothetical protein
MAEGASTLAQRRDDLLFGVRRSVRYHARRRALFDRLHRAGALASLLAGSATFLAVLGKLGGAEWVLWYSGAVVVLSAADLVLGFSSRARGHHDFQRRWLALEREITGAGEYDDERLADFTKRRLLIEEDEEPVLRVLDVLCHNELARAMGREDALYDVGPIQRLLAQWWDWRPDSIKRAAREP